MALIRPGDRIGGYVVEAPLGWGGAGTVYRVRHALLGTTAALKVVERPSAAERARVLREGRIQARLRHPNVLAVHDVVDAPEWIALRMEYAEGGDLAERLRAGRLSRAEAERLFIGVVRGVAAVHRAGVVHRDIKPSNVLLVGPTPVPKVADFGIAFDARTLSPSLTQTGEVLGTLHYRAPELGRAGTRATRASDMFSLGCLFFHLLAGQPPFAHDDVIEALARQQDARWDRPRGLSAGHIAVLERCLAIEPARRPRSCEELLVLLGQPDALRSRMHRRAGAVIGGSLALAGAAAVALGADDNGASDAEVVTPPTQARGEAVASRQAAVTTPGREWFWPWGEDGVAFFAGVPLTLHALVSEARAESCARDMLRWLSPRTPAPRPTRGRAPGGNATPSTPFDGTFVDTYIWGHGSEAERWQVASAVDRRLPRLGSCVDTVAGRPGAGADPPEAVVTSACGRGRLFRRGATGQAVELRRLDEQGLADWLDQGPYVATGLAGRGLDPWSLAGLPPCELPPAAEDEPPTIEELPDGTIVLLPAPRVVLETTIGDFAGLWTAEAAYEASYDSYTSDFGALGWVPDAAGSAFYLERVGQRMEDLVVLGLITRGGASGRRFRYTAMGSKVEELPRLTAAEMQTMSRAGWVGDMPGATR